MQAAFVVPCLVVCLQTNAAVVYDSAWLLTGCCCCCAAASCRLSCVQDDFYLRHLIKNNLLDPVMEAFFANGDRYNLLNSAVLEMVEFIRKENLKVSL